MPFDAALNNTQKNLLRGTGSASPDHEARTYLSVNSNTVVYSGRLNNADWLYPTAILPVDGGSGTPSDIQINMTILVSHTNDITAAYWDGRVRESDGVGYALSGGAGVIYVNQTGDLGFTDNDYYWIIRDYRIRAKLPRVSGDYPITDWNQPFRELRPLVSGIQSVYADWVDEGSGVYEIDIAPVCLATASGAAIDTGSYLHTFPAGITITAGSTTSLNVTIEADPSSTEYHCSFEVSDDNGTTSIFRYIVFAHDADNPPILLSVGEFSVDQEILTDVLEGAAGGYDTSVPAFEGVEDILPGSLVAIWTDQFFATTEADIGSGGNILFVGRSRSEVNSTGYEEGRHSSVEFELEGCLSQLARLRFDPMRIDDVASPANWSEVKDLTVWRAIVQTLDAYSTFLELHSLEFDITSDSFRMPSLTAQGGDILTMVAGLAQSISAVLQDNPAGMCEVVRRLPMLPSADRSGVTNVLDMTLEDIGGPDAIRLFVPHVRSVGLVKGDGGGYNTTTGELSSYRVRAPKSTPLEASSDGQIPRQVLTANQTTTDEKAELSERAGHALAAMWGATEIVLRLPDGYHGLTPDAQARYTLTLPASETTGGRAYTTATYWWLRAKSLSVNPQARRIEPLFTFTQETSGTPGQVDAKVTINRSPFNGVFNEYTPPPEVDTTDGTTDLADATIDVGSVCGSDICSDCESGRHYLDIWVDTGANRTFQTITVTYDADATQSGFQSFVQVRQDGEFFHTVGSPFDVQVGAGNIQEIVVGGVVGRYIRVVLVGDTGGCGDTVTLTGLDYSEIGPRPLDSFAVQANDPAGTDSAINLLLDQRYRVRVSGVVALGAANADFDMLWHLNTSTYNGPFLHVDAVPLAEEAVLDTAFNEVHIYDFIYTGTGSTVNILVGDSPFAYGDNSGEFNVEIYKYG